MKWISAVVSCVVGFVICLSFIPPAFATTDAEAVAEANNSFAIDLYREIGGSDPGANIFFSPSSIYAALAMAYAGARGETASQMAKTLHLALSQERLHPAIAEASAGLEGRQLAMANAIWGQKGLKFRREFLDIADRCYNGMLREVDFEQPGSSLVINRWIEERTRGRVKDLLQARAVGPLTRLIITNAVYFKDNWLSKFDPARTVEMPFHLAGGKTVQTQMMRQERKFRFFEDKRLQILELPYAGRLSMVVILPREGVALETVEGLLAVQGLEWLPRLSPQKVEVAAPKFKTTRSLDLGDVLVRLGMKDAFSVNTADFSGMTATGKLFISSAVHKAFVDVNEEGTEAAAATAVRIERPMAGRSESKSFTADHPFIFMIRDRQSGNLIFMGRLADPTEDKD
jgi:serpin B